MAYTIFVESQEGTRDLQINELLAAREDVEVLKIDPEKRKNFPERMRLIIASDTTLLCLPGDAAKESVALADNPETCIINASTAHRADPAWTTACLSWPGTSTRSFAPASASPTPAAMPRRSSWRSSRWSPPVCYRPTS